MMHGEWDNVKKKKKLLPHKDAKIAKKECFGCFGEKWKV
jgi:hypothetical protein